MKIEAAQRLRASRKDSALNALCDKICDYEDDQVCDNDAGNEIEYYGSKQDLLRVLKALGFKGDPLSDGKTTLELIVPKSGRNFSGKVTYIRSVK